MVLISLILFYENRFMMPKPVKPLKEMKGVIIKNCSKIDPIVMLKHFGPGNPDLNPEDI